MNNNNDEELIGNIIRGTDASQLGHSERSVQEDNAYMTAADNSHNRQILQNGPVAFNTLRSWLNSDSALKSFVLGNAKHRWSQLCPTRASTQLPYDQSVFTCKELNKRLNCAAEFGLAPEKVTTLKCKKELTQLQESMSLPKLGSNNAKQRANLAKAQRRARDTHWQLVRNACASDDHKEYAKDKSWRKQLLGAHSAILEVCDSENQKLQQATSIVRSEHIGRAQIDVNPTQVAIALQPAVDNGSVTKEQAKTMVRIAKDGISVEEFRDLIGESRFRFIRREYKGARRSCYSAGFLFCSSSTR